MKKRILFAILRISAIASVLAMIWILVFPPVQTRDISTIKNEPVYPMDKMDKETLIEQHFICPVSEMKKIKIRFSTYLVKNTQGSIIVSIFDNESNMLLSEVKELSQIEDNMFVTFVLPDRSLGIKKTSNEYVVKIAFNEYFEGNSLTMWHCKTTKKMISYQRDGIDTGKSMQIMVEVKEKNRKAVWLPLLFFVISLSVLALRDTEVKTRNVE